MRRATGLTVSILLLAACAGQSPPPRTPLPDVGLVVPEPQTCAFQIGDGRGVSIDDIIPSSGADGVLVVGDLLVGFDGKSIANADELRDALGGHEVGDQISVDVIREGEQVSAEILLGSNPDAPERPLLGVLIVTDFEQVDPMDVGTSTQVGNLARTIGIGDSIYVLDPATGNWLALGVEVPIEAWAAAGNSILTLENSGTADSALVDAVSGDRLVFDLGDWWAVSLLGTIGSDVVVSAQRLVEGETNLAEPAVVSLDFDDRSVEWIWQLNQGIGVPVATFPSPDGTRLLVAGQSQDDDLFRYTILSATQGTPMSSPDTLAAAEGTVAMGWYDDNSFLVSTNAGVLQLIDAVTGVSKEVTLPPAVGQVSRLTTAGDGVHLLADSGTGLIMLDLEGSTEIRTLADHCLIGLLGNNGWTAAD